MGVFVTSDNHFGHEKVIKYEKRPFSCVEEMNEEMIKRWNNKVKPSDQIYILGDFFHGKGKGAEEILKRLNGSKYLIKGNHDSYIGDSGFNVNLFTWVKDYHVLKYKDMRFVLFHYPIQVWYGKQYGTIHLYGHVHTNKYTHHPLTVELKNAYNVGVDVNNFEPVNIEEIIKKFKQKDL